MSGEAGRLQWVLGVILPSLEAGREGSIRGANEGGEKAKQNHVSLYNLSLVYQRSFQNKDVAFGEEKRLKLTSGYSTAQATAQERWGLLLYHSK